MADTTIHRGVVESVEYATDYNADDTSSGTFITIPRTQILGDGYEAPKETAETVQGMNQQDLMAMLILRGVYPLALKANDTFQTALEQACTNLTPIWFRIKELGKETFKIVGGQFGCILVYEGAAVPQPAGLQMAMFRISAPANEAGQAIQDFTPAGSGS